MEEKKGRLVVAVGGGSSLFNAERLNLQLHADCIASAAENT